MADLPDILPDLDQPLPQVDPNSDLVPYRISRTDPGQQPVVTVGYGPRARPAIQPPGGGGAMAPDLTGLLGEAMQHLPVDQAIKAAEAATRFIGQRGYMRDLQNGANAAQAFAKWGPMLFHQATGIPEAIDRSIPTPITPYQQAQLSLRKQQMQAAADAAKAKAEAAATMTPYQQAQIELRKKEQESKSVALPPEKKAELTDAYKQLDEARKDMAKLVQNPPSKSKAKEHQKSMDDATMRMRDARNTIAKLAPGQVNYAPKETQAAPAPAPQVPNPAAPVKRVRVIGPGGRKGTVPEGATLPEGWKLAE